MKHKTRYHRNLPHINPHGGTYFVTYCLHETISQPEIKQLIQKHQTHLEELRKQLQTTPEQITPIMSCIFDKYNYGLGKLKMKN